ncbi:hypothetical protein HMI54_005092 [Coelomomyces lativittatus]|nr:hypothetical protein HMI54_005092 [Coelomomyces lativittatus]
MHHVPTNLLNDSKHPSPIKRKAFSLLRRHTPRKSSLSPHSPTAKLQIELGHGCQKVGEVVNASLEAAFDEKVEHEPLTSSVHTLTLTDTSLTSPDLPSDWCICRLALDQRTQCLIVTCEHNTLRISLRLPVSRFSLRDGDDFRTDYLESQLKAFSTLINQNNDMLKKEYTSSEDKQRWWIERNELNQALFIWLTNIEASWFGPFRGLLLGHAHPGAPSFLEELVQFLKLQLYPDLLHFDLPLLLLHGWLSIGSTLTDTDFEDIGYFILDEIQRNGFNIEGELLDPLIDFLRSLFLKYKIEDLVLCQHTILILDKWLSSFPLESMSVLHHHSVSRVFSMEMLKTLMKSELPVVRPESTYYLLNPSGDLRTTEETLTPYLKKNPTWKGCIGKVPAEHEFLTALTSHDLFLFFGHGGAETICSPKKFQGLQLPVTFLMGCSSGKLHSLGDFDAMGTVIHYLYSRSPCLVANLWDVTDRDIDRFACSALQFFGIFENKSKPRVNLSKAVALARDDCRFRYLIGAAPVVFGLPVRLLQ